MIFAYVIGYRSVQSTVTEAFLYFAKEEMVPVEMQDTKYW